MYEISDVGYGEGFQKGVSVGAKFNFNVAREKHSVEVLEITEDSVTIVISSDHQIVVTLSIGERIEVDLDGDGVDDTIVELRGITNGIADLFLKQIVKEEVSEIGKEVRKTDKPGEVFTIGIAIASIVIVLAIVISLTIKKKRVKVRKRK